MVARAFLRPAALVVLLALVVVVMAMTPGTAAQAQGVDETLPPLADLSFTAEPSTASSVPWDVTVKANRVGRHPLAVVRNIKVRFSAETVSPGAQDSSVKPDVVVEDEQQGYFDGAIWTIYELPRDGSGVEIRVLPRTHASLMRVTAEILEADPAEPPGFQGNNTMEFWYHARNYTNGDAGVNITAISDASPNAGAMTTFTVRAENEGKDLLLRQTSHHHHQYGVEVKIELSPGLTFAGDPSAPSGTSFSKTNTTTGTWYVGTLESETSNAKSLPVEVNLTSESLSGLPLEKRCLTATVVSATPWFDFDISKRQNDITRACLGEPPKLHPLTRGEFVLLNVHDCVGITSFPCTSTDTVEILAIPQGTTGAFIREIELEVTGGLGYGPRRFRLKPEQITVQVRDHEGRVYDSLATSLTDGNTVSWQTGRTTGSSVPGVKVKYTRRGFNGQITDWSNFVRTVTVSGLNGAAAPGRVRIRVDNSRGSTFYDPNPTHERTPFSLTSTSTAVVSYFIEFSTLGTYLVEFKVKAVRSDMDMTPYTASGTYTFHVGPIAELEVRDAGANPAVADDQQAYTVMAVNNGPDTAPAVRVTGLPTGVTEYVASVGEYDPNSGVWTIGRLTFSDYRSSGHAYEGPTLTLISDDAAGTEITGTTIENMQDYSVVIDGTTHSAAYYDYIDDNNSATITARAGTGEGAPGVPRSVETMPTPLGNILTWQAVERLNGFDVTHYEVQRSASPWRTLSTSTPGTVYVDLEAGSGRPSYRVRAVNIFGVPGPWSEPSSRRPGVPRGFTATVDVGNARIDLSWGAPGEVTGVTRTGYGLEYSTDGGANWTALPNQATTTTAYAHTGRTLTPGATWRYRLHTLGTEGGAAVMSGWVEASAAIPYPVPVNFTATGVSDTKATLSWSAPAGVTPSGFNIQFTKDGGDSWEELADQTASATGFTHTHGALMAGEVPEYRMRSAGTVSGVNVYSDWVRRTTAKDYPAPDAPGSFTATGNSETRATLSWTTPTGLDGTTLSGYELEFSTDGGANWDTLATPTTNPALGATATSSPHTDTNLAADDVRQYRLRTVGAKDGESFYSVWVYAVASENYPAPGAPQNFAAAAVSDTQVNLSWTQPEAVQSVTVTGYNLQVSIASGVRTSLAAGHTTTSYEHDDAANPLSSKSRRYRLQAVGTVGSSSYQSGWVFAVPAEEVGAPQNLAATADGIGRMDLTWDLPAVGADAVTGYRIDYAVGSAGSWQTLDHGYRASPRTYEHTHLEPGQEYCYRVAATYAGGTGPFAARACATTEGAPADLPGEPENLRIARLGSNYVTLEWDAPSVGGDVEYYEWRSNFHDVARVSPATATSVRIGGLATSLLYDFQVRAGNSYGPGQWSDGVQVTLNRAGGVVVASPPELEVEKGGSGSFNIRLKSSPQWPLMVYFHSIGPECLTEQLAYQQFKILVPSNPRPSKAFWDDGWWGPPEDRWALSWRSGVDVHIDASGCRGGETTVIEPIFNTVPFGQLEGLPIWEELGLDEGEWREKWGVDPLDGTTGPSVKVTVVDGD